ncbi:MAG TPA: GntR family transcriptional regulator [Solirubrobacteraceae bacterium]|nr:GntR family transcriptional regulator [Solirubrobacteraceae bacterium]
MAGVRNSVADRVYGQLLGAVLGGRYAPGDALPRQRDLAAELGVTLGSVREGMKRLEQMGLVDVRHGDATRVEDWRERGGLDVLEHLGPAVVPAILEARSLMLREMAGLAAGRREPGQAARLGELARELGAVRDVRAAAELDFAFFTEVARAAGNIVFQLILNAIRETYFAHLDDLPVTGDPPALALGYTAVADAIAGGDGEAARAAAFALAEVQRQAVLG